MLPARCRALALLLTLLALLASWLLAHHCHQRLPPPLLRPSGQDQFVAGLAHRTLARLTSFGPRPVGSFANDVQAVRFLTDQLSHLARTAGANRTVLEAEVQTVEGSFGLDRLTQVYTGLRNVVARVSPRSAAPGPRPALLLNCHFDSVPQGPGASDDGVSCAVMLEVIRVVLASRRATLTNDLIFLFNGAEEALLPASHGFITQHRWAPDVKAFINLEAAGSGGRELLFQAGPGHRWLLEAYIQAAPHPFASILAQEVFQSGAIPSDTDFRVFRDFGHLPGLDIAFVLTGQVYHTEHDTADRVPLGSVQRAGDNVLAVALRLARRRSLGPDDGGVGVVFFDVLGLGMVSLPAWAAVLANLAAVATVGLLLQRDAEAASKKMDISVRTCLKATAIFVASEAVGLAAALALCCTIGSGLALLGLTMTWYSRPSFLFSLYACPAAATLLEVSGRVRDVLPTLLGRPLSEEFLQTFCLHAVKVVYALLILGLTLLGIKSAFLFTFTVVFLLAWEVLRSRLVRPRGWTALLLLLLLLLLPLALSAYIIQLLITIFLPVMGRRGSAGNPDLILGAAVAALTVAHLHPLLPTLGSVRRRGLLLLLLLLGGLVAPLRLLLGQGFPYSAGPDHPAPQRLSLYHVVREVEGRVEAGLLVGRWDAHWAVQLTAQVPEYAAARPVDGAGECQRWLGCGFPLHRFSLDTGKGALWLNDSVELPSLAHSPRTGVREVARQPTARGTNLTLEVTGPGLVEVLVAPGPGWALAAWGPATEPRPRGHWRSRPVYHLRFVRALGAGPQRVWLELEGGQEGQELLTVTAAGHYTSGQDMVGPALRQFLRRQPAWVSPAAWTVHYKYLVF